MDQTILIAVYDTTEKADAAMRDLEAMLPASAIGRHDGETLNTGAAPEASEPGFWSAMFGGPAGRDESLFGRDLAGGVVLTAQADAMRAAEITQALERHGPVHLASRAATSPASGASDFP